MKLLPFIALVSLAVFPSCERVRQLSTRLSKIAPATNPPATAIPAEPAVEITPETYEAFQQKTGKVIIIDFYADWCGPCRKLSPILEKIAAEHAGNVIIGKVNVDQCREIAAQERISSIPDVRIFRDGKKVDQFVGLPEENEVRQIIQRAAKGLKTPPPSTAAENPQPKKEPDIQPMKKGWMPEGIQRR